MDQMKERVKRVISALVVKEPFFGLLLKRTWILYDAREEQIAWTDGARIFLGEPASKLPEEELAGVLLHEIAHVVLKHVLRVQDLQKRYALPPELLNVIADAVANKYVLGTEAGKFLQKLQPITPEHIAALFGISDVERKSLEEIAAELRKASAQTKKPGLKATIDGDLLPKTSSEADACDKSGADERSSNSSTCKAGEESNSERNAGKRVLNEGDEGEGPDARLSPDEVERRVERKVADAFVVAKTARAAGTVPAALERLVEEILKPKVDWRRLLREKLRAFIGSDYLPSWHKLNKKLPGLRPGKRYVEASDIVALIDTSGSIDEKTLQQFVSEVFAVARATGRKVVVIPWDARAYEPFEVRGYEDLSKVKIRGGGGTVIAPALRAAEKLMRPTTKIVILSDWEIYDLTSKFVQEWLRKHRHQIIAVTTHNQPPFLHSVKIDL